MFAKSGGTPKTKITSARQRNFISRATNKYQELKRTEAIQKCQENQVDFLSESALKQFSKYLQGTPFVKEDCYLGKAFNEGLTSKISEWVKKKMRHQLDSVGMPNLVLNIFKVLKYEKDKKECKSRHKFFQMLYP